MKGNQQMSYTKPYLRYRHHRSVNDSLEKLMNLDVSDDKKFIKNSRKIVELLKENEYIIEQNRSQHRFKDVREVPEMDSVYVELIKLYCQYKKITFENLQDNRQSEYSILRFAWYYVLAELGLGCVRIGNLFNKDHTTISNGRKNRNMKYDLPLRTAYNEIKEFVNNNTKKKAITKT